MIRQSFCIACFIENRTVDGFRKAIEATGSKSKIVFQPLPQDDPVKRKPDISKAKAVLNGWEPKISLDEGLALTVEYFRSVLKTPWMQRMRQDSRNAP